MKKFFIKALKIGIPLAVGVLLVVYSITSASAEERQLLWNNIVNANPFWIVFSVVIGILSHMSRAIRWKYLVAPMGYTPKFSTSFMAVMIGYFANLGIPRSGEFLRAATLSNYEKIPFQKSIGTIITERVIDSIMLLVVIFITFLLNTKTLVTYFTSQSIKPSTFVIVPLLMIAVLGIGYWIIIKLRFSFIEKFRKFALEVYEGMLSVFKMKNKWSFIFHTIFIWIAYVAMFYVIKYSIPETEALSVSIIFMAFIAGSIAMMTTNGGVGAFPIAIGLVLVLFGYDKQIGEAMGWIIWGSQTLMNIIFGGLSFVLLPILNRKK